MKQDLPSSRLSRWVLQLQATSPFKIIHRSGASNLNVDTLSRAIPLKQIVCSLILAEDHWHQKLHTEQESDNWCQSKLSSGTAFREPSGLICETVQIGPTGRKVVLLTQALVKEVITHFHSGNTGGHWGEQITFEIIRRRFLWPEMRKDVREFVTNCEPCTINKYRNTKKPGPLGTHTNASHFNQIVYVDIAGPLPQAVGRKKYVLVMADGFTRWVELASLSSITTHAVIRAIKEEWILRYGPPEAILTDNGAQFGSEAFSDFCREFTIRDVKITPYNPQANMAERIIRDLKQGLRILTEGEERRWADKLQQVAFALRTKVNSSTGFAPAELLFGAPLRHSHDIPGPLDNDPTTNLPMFITAARNADVLAKLSQKTRYDANRPKSSIQIGEIVHVDVKPSTCLSPLRSRAFRVLDTAGPRAFKLQNMDNGNVVTRHVSFLTKGGVV